MKKFQSKKTSSDKYLITLFGVAAFFLVLAVTSKYGAGLSPDAVAYLFAAKSYDSGNGFLYFGYSTPMIQWPPLFPALIALFSSAGFKAAAAARFINAALFGLIVILSGHWFRRHIKFKPYALAATASVLLSVPLLHVSGYIWSEPLFVFLVLAFMVSLDRFYNEGKRKGYWLSAIFAGLACLTRYMGVIAVFTGLAVIVLKKEKPKNKIKDIFVFGVISCLPLLSWAIRNYINSNTLFGSRTPSGYSLLQTTRLGVETILQWLLPIRQLDAQFSGDLVLYAGLLLAFILAALLAAVVYIARLNLLDKWKKVNVYGWSQKNAAPAIPPLLFSVFYTVYLIYTASAIAFDKINDRLMVPVYVPLMFLLFYLLDNIPLLFYKYFRSRALSITLVIAVGLWLIYPVYGVYIKAASSIENGIGMASEAHWKDSELMAKVKEKANNEKIFSNFAERTYAHAGVFSEYVPRKGSLPEYGLEPFKKTVKENEGSYLAWFNKPGMLKSLYTLEELKADFNLSPVFEASDGTLYTIGSR